MADLTPATQPHVAIPDLSASVRSGRTLLALDLGTTTGWALHGIDGLITSAQAKLGLDGRTRSSLAAWAVRVGLVPEE